MIKWCSSEQTLKLVPGQVVEALVNKKVVKCEVISPNELPYKSWKSPYVLVRRLGKTADGGKHPTIPKYPNEIICEDFSKDPVRPNIFADWLDDHGFPDAAQALREAFPLIPLEE